MPRDRSARDSFRIAGIYLVLGVVWFAAIHMLTGGRGQFGLVAGLAFILLSSAVGYVIGLVYLGRLHRSQTDFAEAQLALRQRDIAIRQAYVDVLSVVTGGKLILMTPEELRYVLGADILTPAPLASGEDVAGARHRLREALAPLTGRADDVQLAASEALTNVLKHAGGGRYWLARSGECLQFVAEDEGPGIDFATLPKATLMPGFSTEQSLGMGFTIMLEISDRVLLATEPGRTSLVLEFDLAAPEQPGTTADRSPVMEPADVRA